MDLRTYWLALRAGWRVVLGVVAVFAVGTLLVAWPSGPTYASTTRLFIAASTDTDGLAELDERNAMAAQRIASYVELVGSSSVAEDVESAIDVDVDENNVVASGVPGTVIISVTVIAGDAETARTIAAGYAEVLPRTIAELEPVRDSGGPRLRAVVIDEATLPTAPEPNSFTRDLFAGLILGLGVGLGLAVLRYAVALRGSTRADELDPQ